MLPVGFTLVVLCLTLSKGDHIGNDGETCSPNATLCKLDNKLRNMEVQMGHCLNQLTILGEFKEKITLDVVLLASELKDLRNNRPENVVLIDKSTQTEDPDAISKNVTSLMNRIAAEEKVIKELSDQVAALHSEKSRLQVDLEIEKRYRRSLTERLTDLDMELKESKSWKPMVEDMRIRLDNLTKPTQNLTVILADLIEERDILKSEMENERDILKNLEAHIYLLETELNKTNNLKIKMEHLDGKMDQLKSNITNETVDLFEQIIEVKLANMEGTNNEKAMDEKLKVLEYHLEDKQNNVSTLINSTLNSRVSKIEELLSAMNSAQNNISEKTSEILKLEISEIKGALNQSNQAAVARMLIFEDNLETIKENISSLDYVNSLFREEIRDVAADQKFLAVQMINFNESQTKVEFENEERRRALEELFDQLESLNKNLTNLKDIFMNVSSDRWSLQLEDGNSTLFDWEEEILNLKRNQTILNEKITNVVIAADGEMAELKEELDQLQVRLVDLDHDWDRNLTAINSRVKHMERLSSGFSGHLVRLQKVETSLGKMVNREDFSQHDEKIARLYVNISKLRGQSEDFHRKLDTWNVRIAEAKNWVAEHVDREYKKLEKQINRSNEILLQKVNHSVEEKIEDAKIQIKKTMDKHEEHISYLYNQSNLLPWNGLTPTSSESNISTSENVCTPSLDWDSNLVLNYKSRPLTDWTKPLNDSEELIFRCSHIGRYVLVGPKKIICQDGLWSSAPPFCRKLADEDDINESRDVSNFCRLVGNGQHLFPLDCTQYYNCMNLTYRIESCPLGLYFDNLTKSCVHRKFSDCDDRPSIDYSPLPGTSEIPVGITPDGTLIVSPGQNLILTCIYPVESGTVQWKVKTKDVVKSHLTTLSGDKNHRLELKHVNESNSGIYSCVKTDGEKKIHSIDIQIKNVYCPEISANSPLIIENITMSRRLASKLSFSCHGNHSLVGPSSIICLANGQWSSELPTCKMKGCLRPNTTEDAWISFSPDLSFYPVNSKLYLECEAGAPVKSIPAIVRCLSEGKWNINPFPTCYK